MDAPFRIGMLLSTLVLMMMAGWRWHDARATEPDRITGLDGPALVLVVRSNDCPDRRAALDAWLARMGPPSADDGPTWALGIVDREDPWLDGALASMPRLEPGSIRTAGRALLRSGLDGTPAVLVVDERGYVVLAEAFAAEGPGGRLDLLADIISTWRPGARGGASSARTGA